MKKIPYILVMILILTGCEPTDVSQPIVCNGDMELIAGECELKDEVVYPQPQVNFVRVGYNSADFEIVIPDNQYNLEIVKLVLIEGDTSIEITDLFTRELKQLKSDTQYELEYTYSHDSENGTFRIKQIQSISFHTDILMVAPEVNFEVSGEITDTALILVNVFDPSEVLEIETISLFNGTELVSTYSLRSSLILYNLVSSTEYQLVIEYKYDLGEGYIAKSEEITFTTPIKEIEYFCDIALGFEFGNAEEVTRKWNQPMKIFVDGTPTEDMLQELDSIVNELNSLFTDGFYIEIVEEANESNFQVVLSNAEYYVENYNVNQSYTDSNWGLFTIYYNSNNYLQSGHMYVDIVRAGTLAQKHLLREELTQALGLAKDSTQYMDSIFQQVWTTTTRYAEIDKDLIWLLYHPDMIAGLNELQVRELLVDLLYELPEHN